MTEKTKKKKLVLASAFMNEFYKSYRYKVLYGGRIGMKTTELAKMAVMRAVENPVRLWCARAKDIAIDESVYTVIIEEIERVGLRDSFFTIQSNRILGENGSVFIFRGINDRISPKGVAGIDICWVDEAQELSRKAWAALTPTIRKKGSEIWISFNPENKRDIIYETFVLNSVPNSIVHKTSWRDTPYLTDALRQEKDTLRARDYQEYLHVWEGELQQRSDALVFDNWGVEEFEAPDDAQFAYGADWGFSIDPTVLVRSYIVDNKLYIDKEIGKVGVEIDSLARFFNRMEGARKYAIIADSSRPELISKMKSDGFRMRACKKWPQSVKAGVDFLKKFDKIVVHPDCVGVAGELASYKYKVHTRTDEVLPELVDKDNHFIDALRYSYDTTIRGKNRLRVLVV